MKAYELNLDKIEEGYRYDSVIAYGETRGKAKSKIWEEIENYGYGPLYFDGELTFLNLPIRRAKEYDKIEFEGKLKTKREIEEIEVDRKRIAKLNSFLNNTEITHCYIQKGSYYRPGSCGYTSFKSRAGVYTIKEGVSHARSCEDIWLEIIDINEHNKMLKDEIESLKSRLV
ncbi:MAG: hypothetical protein ACJAVA_000200 [Flavobacteriaceae bacterium]|jgi:hypothetical protein